MIFTELILHFTIIGIIGGLLGVFYRNCLKVPNMIFYDLYIKILMKWKEGNNKFLAWVAMPLGGCIYCSTFWITLILSIIYLTTISINWQYIVISIVLSSSIQHILVVVACRWIINNHPDLDNE